MVKRSGPGRAGQAGLLNRTRIVQAALHIAETSGVELLTMRRVADEIGTAPMSLYRHVADKRQLLLALLDEVAKELTDRPLPAPPDPRERIIATVLDAHRVLRSHQWVANAILAAEELPPRALRLSEHILAALYLAGLDEETAADAHMAIWHYTWGHLFFGHLSTVSVRAFEEHELARDGGYPALSRTAGAMHRGIDEAFAVGLVALVDGFLAHRTH